VRVAPAEGVLCAPGPPERPGETVVLEVTPLMEQPSSHVKIRRDGDVLVVEFADRKILEELSIHEILEELKTLAASEPKVKLLLDFGNVDHLASAALGMLLTLLKSVQEQQGTMKLANINRQIYQVFKITRLNKVFDIHDTADQAMASF
jgi:anti-sigma B factor antagonist